MSVVEEIHRVWSDRGSRLLVVLITYTVLLQFEPSEPYLVPYLTRFKQFSNNEVTVNIFPVGVYTMFCFTLLAAPACHFFSYRSVIILGSFGKLATFIILLFGKTLISMQLMQVTYGLGTAADLVFSSYIFLLVSEKDYQIVTSYTQASSLISFVFAAELGQLLVDQGSSIESLLYVSIVSVALSCAMSSLLPRQNLASQEQGFISPQVDASWQGLRMVVKETWQGTSLRLLSFWWVFGTAGFGMIPNYGTNLFNSIDPTANSNGHVLAVAQVAGCAGALAAAYLSNTVAQTGGYIYILGSAFVALLCASMAWSNTLWCVYFTYVIAIGVNQLLLCLIYVQCAKCLPNRQFILLFSLNSVAGLLIQSTLQAAIVYMQLPVTRQFYAFAIYCLTLTVVFWSLCLTNSWRPGVLVPVDTTLLC